MITNKKPDKKNPFFQEERFVSHFLKVLLHEKETQQAALVKLLHKTKTEHPEYLDFLNKKDISKQLDQVYPLEVLHTLVKAGIFDPYKLHPTSSALAVFIKSTQPGYSIRFTKNDFDTLFDIFDRQLFDPKKETLYCMNCLSQPVLFNLIKDLFEQKPRHLIQKKATFVVENPTFNLEETLNVLLATPKKIFY